MAANSAVSSSLRGLGDHASVLLGARAQVQQQRGIAAVVEDHVGVPPSGHSKMRCVNSQYSSSDLALVGEHRRCRPRRSRRRHGPGSRRCCRKPSAPRRPAPVSVSISTAVWMVMCSEPAMRAPLQRLRGGEFLANRHEPGHLGLGDGDFLAPPVGQVQVGDRKSVVVATGMAASCRSSMIS